MNIDERLDKLMQRHEALTQTVELWITESRAQFKQLDERLDRVVGIVEHLAHIADSHNDRLDKLEGAA